jgi:hypothetical protein
MSEKQLIMSYFTQRPLQNKLLRNIKRNIEITLRAHHTVYI